MATNTRDTSIVGITYGMLTIKSLLPNRKCLCDCACGKTGVVKLAENVKRLHTRSCGCASRIMRANSNTKHGHNTSSNTSIEYSTWSRMISRCHSPNNPCFKNYGGRGIKVHEAWRSDFAAFLKHVGSRPGPGYSIDRYPNNDGNYEPGNVRWATSVQQNRNRRDNVLLTVFGVTGTVSEWAERIGFPVGAIHHRLKRGWDHERIVTTPLRVINTSNRRK